MRAAWLLRDGTVLAAAEVCEGLVDRTRGLLGRAAYDGAMLLPHTRSVHTVGMRFPMDVAVLDRDLAVLCTVRAAPWRVVLPRRGGRSVLEAAAGSFERWGLCPGDRLEIRETR
ncbi:MAG: DUF192 domain-containing protein [Acidimicrobiales bacterium]